MYRPNTNLRPQILAIESFACPAYRIILYRILNFIKVSNVPSWVRRLYNDTLIVYRGRNTGEPGEYPLRHRKGPTILLWREVGLPPAEYLQSSDLSGDSVRPYQVKLTLLDSYSQKFNAQKIFAIQSFTCPYHILYYIVSHSHRKIYLSVKCI